MHRIDIPDIPYHVFSRGNNKERIFFDERDRLTYLKIIRQAMKQFAFELYSYALMDNHIHLLLKMLHRSRLGQLMHRIQLSYAKHINRKYGRVGHLFQSRYHSNLVDTDRYFLMVDRYIHLNPVRAGMVKKPEEFKWSSYSSRLNKMNSDWLTHGVVLDYFGSKDDAQRIKNYKRYTESALNSPEEWPHEILQKTTYLGSLEFGQRILVQKAAAKSINSHLSNRLKDEIQSAV